MIIDRITLRHRWLAIGLFVFPVLFLTVSEYLRAANTDLYIRLFTEDGPAEYGQAIMFFVASLLAASMSRTFAREGDRLLKWLHALLALGLFLTAMEEISWGQRIFSVSSPSYFQEYNRQGELNLHNLAYVQSQDGFDAFYFLLTLVEFYTMGAWLLIPRRLELAMGERVHFLVPSWNLVPLFFLATWWRGCRSCQEAVAPVIWQVQEPPEFLIAMGALVFLVLGRHRQRRMRLASRI